MLLNSSETDWLCTNPVFYNEKTGAISRNMREVIDFGNLEFDKDGLNNYLKFGYTAFGQTMVKNVKALDHSSQIVKNDDGTLSISKKNDVAKELYNPGQTNGSQVFEEIVESVKSWSSELENATIILPLSGGLDSRLLAYSTRNQDNVYAYSYGLSAKQRDSFEVVKAKSVAASCGLKWESIDLDDFLREDYLSRWYDIYGPSMHLHGMYQMEFYDKIINKQNEKRELASPQLNLLSGIIGDGWAGTVRIPVIKSADDLKYLGYTHGMSIEEDISLVKGNKPNESMEAFYEEHREELEDENFRIIYAMRTKMMLLHYLLTTPNNLGMKTYSPFLDPKISMDIVNLDWSLKTDRVWQHREFEKRNLNIGWEKDKCDYNMVIDIEAFRKNPVRPLNENLLGRVIKEDFIKNVNKQISRKPLRPIPAKPRTAQNMYNKAVKKYNKNIDLAIIQYEILSSIERLMIEAEKG